MQERVCSDRELDSWLRLLLTPYIGSVSAISLMRRFGLPSEVFSQSATSLKYCGLQERQVNALLRLPDAFEEQRKNVYGWMEKSCDTRHVVTIADGLYPQSLLNISDPPVLLFILSHRDELSRVLMKLESRAAVAIVGSRKATPQGLENARAFSKSLAVHGCAVVSGLALGVDAAAHAGALEAGKNTTVAVVGTGLDRVYPAKNRELAHRIVNEGGAIFSEFPLGTAPAAGNFPKRNRLLAAMTAGTLVIEAGMKSGSLITARLASETGKEVFAVPGSIHSPQSKGCHYLIKQGAKLVESTDDVLSELQMDTVDSISSETSSALPKEKNTHPGQKRKTDKAFSEKDTIDAGIMDKAGSLQNSLLDVMGFDAVHIDTLVEIAGMEMHHLQAELLSMELDNKIKRLPGGWFQRHVVDQTFIK